MHLSEIDSVLAACGLFGVVERKGSLWTRVYIHLSQGEGKPSLYLGRAMFKLCKLSHIKWHCQPLRELTWQHQYYYNFHLQWKAGIVLDSPAWLDLVARAEAMADEAHAEKVNKRAGLPVKKRQPLMPRNPARYTGEIVSDYINGACAL